jgi:hypothetical protein
MVFLDLRPPMAQWTLTQGFKVRPEPTKAYVVENVNRSRQCELYKIKALLYYKGNRLKSETVKPVDATVTQMFLQTCSFSCASQALVHLINHTLLFDHKEESMSKAGTRSAARDETDDVAEVFPPPPLRPNRASGEVALASYNTTPQTTPTQRFRNVLGTTEMLDVDSSISRPGDSLDR